MAEDLERAQRAAARADLFLALGTSLGVYPAAALPEIALRAGARLVIVNAEETPFDAVRRRRAPRPARRPCSRPRGPGDLSGSWTPVVGNIRPVEVGFTHRMAELPRPPEAPPRPRSARSIPPTAEARLGDATFLDVREQDEFEQGMIPGSVFIPRGHLESQAENKLPDRDAPIVIYCAGGNRSAFAAKTLARARLHRRRLDGRRLRPLEERGPRVDHARGARPRAAQPLQPPHPAPRGRRGRPAEAARVEGAAARRGRPRLAGRAVPRGGGRRHARHRRHGRGRRVEPAAPDPPQHGPHRRPQGRLREEDAHRAQPRRRRRHLRRALRRRQRPRHHRAATTSSSTAPTTSRRATCSTTRRC